MSYLPCPLLHFLLHATHAGPEEGYGALSEPGTLALSVTGEGGGPTRLTRLLPQKLRVTVSQVFTALHLHLRINYKATEDECSRPTCANQ